ncbi:Na(+)/H(+) antiporter [Lachnellula subtilissima]|uniref:Na(+)/H(+) antiporter n=1 Tax=Lachnellula subtilissima TaxID=602034 RepID=A0A8H8RNZ1_9HELO|nr:Na(+)/H(+) antiporter [Lachnellula subtilissima]
MPTLAITNFNIVCSVLGGFITLYGLVSYLFKEKFYLSESCVIFSPHATNFIKPLDYTNNSQASLNDVTLYFTRLVLGVQLVLAGVQLPSRYLHKEWKSLALLVGPVMTLMWLASSLLVWGLVPGISFLQALAIGACVTPTDPVLSNSIVKGKFADKNVPPGLQKIVVAESGANDGLGYPFLFFALYLIKYTGEGGAGQHGGARTAMGLWFGETWGYTIILSVIYGATVGWIAKELLHWAEEKRFIDRESFLVFAITLALFIVGTCGMIGSDDVLACFIAGNAFTWDDWFRLETEDDALQPTIDMLLNLRLPVVFAFHKLIHQIEDTRQAIFVGFFGPIGVSAVFYLYISLDFLETITVDGVQREDAKQLSEIMMVVIWFLAICSIVVHGLSIPLGKLGFFLPRTLSRAFSSRSQETDEVFRVSDRARPSTTGVLRERRPRRGRDRSPSSAAPSTRPIYRIGGSVIQDASDVNTGANTPAELRLSRPSTPPNIAVTRTIRFPDDEPAAVVGADRIT